MQQFQIPDQVEFILERLEGAGYPAYPVGGCVRDLLLGIEPHDWDVTTAATPEQMELLFAENRLIKTGIQHGTVTIVQEDLPVEVTTFRSDGCYRDGRHPTQVTFSNSLQADLSRRDFTINALCLDETGAVVDWVGGLTDLKAGCIRAIGDATTRFEEDALRILRALRFSARFGFFIESATATAMHQLQDRLALLSVERIFTELCGLITAPHCLNVLLQHRALLFAVVPELAATDGLFQRPDYHCYDVYTHICHSIAAAPPQLPIRLAMLLHDLGKPACAHNGHFKGHAAAGALLADVVLQRLKAPNSLREQVVQLVALHDSTLAPDRVALRRLLAKMGAPQLFALIEVYRADNTAKHPETARARLENAQQVETLLHTILSEHPALSLHTLAINGKDLLALGFPPGPTIGQTLNQLLTLVIEEKLPNEKGALLNCIKTNPAAFL